MPGALERFSGLLNNVETVVHGAWDGYIYQEESGTTFNGSSIKNVKEKLSKIE